MSTAAATARYVIAADDKTASAIRSVLSGFQKIDKGVQSTVKTMNSALGIFVGVQLTQGFRKILQATAESTEGQKTFALALGSVKDSVTDLLSAKSGLPEATAKMEELRDILRDPTLVAAADAVTSTLIEGFTAVAKAGGELVAGLRVLGLQAGVFQPRSGQERQEANDREIERLEAELKNLESGAFSRVPRFDDSMDLDSIARPADIAALRSRIKSLRMDSEILQNLQMPTLDVGTPNIPDIFTTEDAARIKEAREKELRDFMDSMEMHGKLVEDMKGMTIDAIQDLDDEVAKSFKDGTDEILNDIEYTLDEWEKGFDKMGVFADQAARNMQTSFADFLFDPFEDGLKGMAKGFIDVIRRMLAEAAAAKVFETLFGKTGAGTKFLGTILGAVGSYGGGKASGGPLESGKWYMAGEKGPEPIWGGGPGAFAMGYGGSGGGGISIAPVYNIDARGATMELANALPGILQQNNEQLKADIISGIQRGKYPIKR